MTQSKIRLYLALAFVISMLAIGIPYWLIPYQQVGLPSTLYTPALAVPVLAAFLLRFLRMVSLGKVVWVLATSLATAVMLRVMVETSQDPTSHNLWPFELIMAEVLGLLCVLPAAVLGGIMAQLKGSTGTAGEN